MEPTVLIDNYELSDQYKKYLRVGDTADVLREDARAGFYPALVVWRDAMKHPDIENSMQTPEWPVNLLTALSVDKSWRWEARHSDVVEEIKEDRARTIELVAAASGVKSTPAGNLIVVLNLRDYTDKASDVGNYEWWRSQEYGVSSPDLLTRSLFSKTADMLLKARNVGADFCVEQMAVVVAKDATKPSPTLTPTLHSDMYYGVRETALVSLLEKGFNPFGGTVFVPTVKMDTLEEHRPINMQKLLSLLPDEPIVKSRGNDVVFYDGMIGLDGSVSTGRGIPHISSDQPGTNSRLVLLMRNRKLPQPIS